MAEMKERDPKKLQEEYNGFTGMPNEKPFPDFEPEQCMDRQVEQFENTANTGKAEL